MDVVYFYKFIDVEKLHGFPASADRRSSGQKAAVQERSFFVGQISRQAGGSVRQAQAAGRLCVV